MKEQIATLLALQERVLIRDGFSAYRNAEEGRAIRESIAELERKLNDEVRAAYERQCAKGSVFAVMMTGETCAGCGLKVPGAQQQELKVGQSLVSCLHCGRILCLEPPNAVHGLLPKPSGKAQPKSPFVRFLPEGTVLADLKAQTPAAAIVELAQVLRSRGLVTDAQTLAAVACEREAIQSTALATDMAFPHARGVEGGNLVFAVGRSTVGIPWPDEPVHYVFLAAIPIAVSAYYARLVKGLLATFAVARNRGWVDAAEGDAALWKAILKATRCVLK